MYSASTGFVRMHWFSGSVEHFFKVARSSSESSLKSLLPWHIFKKNAFFLSKETISFPKFSIYVAPTLKEIPQDALLSVVSPKKILEVGPHPLKTLWRLKVYRTSLYSLIGTRHGGWLSRQAGGVGVGRTFRERTLATTTLSARSYDSLNVLKRQVHAWDTLTRATRATKKTGMQRMFDVLVKITMAETKRQCDPDYKSLEELKRLFVELSRLSRRLAAKPLLKRPRSNLTRRPLQSKAHSLL